MATKYLPLAYRWFLAKELTNWQPWHFVDTDASVQHPPDYSANHFAAQAFKTETAADFDVYLFARRQDMDDYAFFVVRNGVIEDKVVSIHLSFANKLELAEPLRHADVVQSFTQWIRDAVIADVEDWISDADMYDQ